MRLRFTPRAAQDLASIAAYIRELNPPSALRVRAAILESLQTQGFARVALAEGYLAASAYGLDFGIAVISLCPHAIMLSCLHAADKCPSKCGE